MIGTVRGVFTLAGRRRRRPADLARDADRRPARPAATGRSTGIVAGAGLTMALSQLFGGWTKWGWPRISAGVFADRLPAGAGRRRLDPARRPARRELVPAPRRHRGPGTPGSTASSTTCASSWACSRSASGSSSASPSTRPGPRGTVDAGRCAALDAGGSAAGGAVSEPPPTLCSRRPRHARRQARARRRPRSSSPGSGIGRRRRERAITRAKMSVLAVSPRRRGTELLLAHMSGPVPAAAGLRAPTRRARLRAERAAVGRARAISATTAGAARPRRRGARTGRSRRRPGRRR